MQHYRASGVKVWLRLALGLYLKMELGEHPRQPFLCVDRLKEMYRAVWPTIKKDIDFELRNGLFDQYDVELSAEELYGLVISRVVFY